MVTSDRCWIIGGVVGRDDIVWNSDKPGGEQGVLYSAEAFRTIPRPERRRNSSDKQVLVLSWREL
jgi:hypothetical protein